MAEAVPSKPHLQPAWEPVEEPGMVWSLDSAEQARICFKPVLPSTLGGDSVRAEGSCATNFRCPRRCFFAAHRHVQAVSHPRRCLLVGTLQLPLRCVLYLPTLLPRTATSSTRTSQPVASLMAFGGETAHVGVAFSDGSSTVYSPIVQSPARQPSLALEQHLLGATAFVFFPLTAQPGGPPLVAATAGTDMRIKVHSVVDGACGASMSGSTAPITALGVLPWQGEAPYALASADREGRCAVWDTVRRERAKTWSVPPPALVPSLPHRHTPPSDAGHAPAAAVGAGTASEQGPSDVLAQQAARVSCLCVVGGASPLVVTGSQFGIVCAADTRGEEVVCTAMWLPSKAHTTAMAAVCAQGSAEASCLVADGEGGLWHLRASHAAAVGAPPTLSCSALSSFLPPGECVTSLALPGASQDVFVGCSDGSVRLWRGLWSSDAPLEVAWLLGFSRAPVTALSVCSVGEDTLVCAGHEDGVVQAWRGSWVACPKAATQSEGDGCS